MSLFVMSPCYCPDASPADGMMATARRVGLEPHLYGVGQTINTNCSNAQGTDMLALIESRTEDYILCVDCMDIAFLAGENEIMEKFRLFRSDLVISTEADGISGLANTKTKLHQMCIESGGYHPQLNIGAWIGRREYALHVFREAERLWRHRPEDASYNYDVLPQWLMQMKSGIGPGGEYVGPEGPEFALDWKDVLFQSMNKAETEWMPNSRRIWNTVTNTLPILLHYNGDKTYAAHREMVKRILQ